MSDRHNRALDKLGATLAPLFDKEDFELAKLTLIECCRATRRVRAGKDRETGAYLYEDQPDHPTRLVAAVKVLEWVAGKPIARSISANLTPTNQERSHDDFMADVMRDPAAIRSMQDVLGKLASAAENGRPVDVVATLSGSNEAK